jgi:hypothetical protein
VRYSLAKERLMNTHYDLVFHRRSARVNTFTSYSCLPYPPSCAHKDGVEQIGFPAGKMTGYA